MTKIISFHLLSQGVNVLNWASITKQLRWILKTFSWDTQYRGLGILNSLLLSNSIDKTTLHSIISILFIHAVITTHYFGHNTRHSRYLIFLHIPSVFQIWIKVWQINLVKFTFNLSLLVLRGWIIVFDVHWNGFCSCFHVHTVSHLG